ncbi:hypothetical protein OIU76_028133 [Salix suchowensis]|uniref:1-phosphatidylinositol 4-kinase n=1 Tax=Salix suchowensis TaxID=1278906 RepID=A0ABQ9B279_9ROSI|nr:hypothetical protein OIU76_028133 [Salix suchowensis]KAJ6371170.1 hypothetical protein OIU77_001638 [Salix suchowensis]
MQRKPSWNDLQQDDWSGLIEILGFSEHFAEVKQMVNDIVKAMRFFNVDDGVDGNKNQQRIHVRKIASLQQFIPHDFDASDYGTSSFLVTAVHGIGILDVELIPIDHGLCLPESLEDPYSEWIQWRQASTPFSDDELEYINNPEPFQDSGMLRRELPLIREACLGFLAVCTIFLKAEIGEMMSREFQVRTSFFICMSSA